jgi:hypothetical protein
MLAALPAAVGDPPAPANALPLDALVVAVVGVTEEVELAVAMLLSGVVVNSEESTAERPVVAMEIRFWLEVLFVRTGEAGWDAGAVSWDGEGLGVPESVAWPGRFVSFR